LLQRRGAIDEDEASDLAGIVGGVVADVDAGDGVAHEDDGAVDMGGREEGVEFGGDVVGVAGRREGLAPAEAGAVVRADAGGLSEGGLDAAPDEAVVAEAGVEDEGGRTGARTVEAHAMAVDGVEGAGRMGEGTMDQDGVGSAAGGGGDGDDSDEQEDGDFDELAQAGGGAEGADAAESEPDDEDCGEDDEGGDDDVEEVHGVRRNDGSARAAEYGWFAFFLA
jgi:hypothetical protein